MNLEQIRDAIASDTEFITSNENGDYIGIIPDDIYGRVLKMRVDGEIRMTTKHLDRPGIADRMVQFWVRRLEIKND